MQKETFISRRLCVSGDPKYGVPILDPFFVKQLAVKELGLAFNLSDFTVEGAKDATLQDIK
jgi:hypothetical protein